MLGHCFLCLESKIVDKRQKRTKTHTTTCKLLDFLSAKQKNIFSHTALSPEFNLEVLKGCALWQLPLSLSLCTQCLFTHTCLYILVLHSDSSSCLSVFLFPPHQTQQSQPFTVYLFSVTIWISLSCCVAILNPKTLHHQSPGLGLLLFPDTSTFSLPFHPTFHYPKSQNTSQILSPVCTDIETGIRTAHFLFMLGACTWLFLPTLPYLPFEDEVICSHHLN